MPIEINFQTPMNNFARDVWAIGCVFFALLANRHLFPDLKTIYEPHRAIDYILSTLGLPEFSEPPKSKFEKDYIELLYSEESTFTYEKFMY